MTVTARVASWRREEGWGVVECDQTTGGCWVHFSAIDMTGFKELRLGQSVELEWEHAAQDGYRFRAISVRPHDQPPGHTPTHPGASQSAAYRSGLSIDCDPRPDV